ncbi:hypothetical protein ACFRCG_00525 [Embleya sp. NPDC056575]|uniref:hypothetical protein n=1 Tax=unclassified Embleya TaxID=2699296 RepID=UPI003689E284
MDPTRTFRAAPPFDPELGGGASAQPLTPENLAERQARYQVGVVGHGHLGWRTAVSGAPRPASVRSDRWK